MLLLPLCYLKVHFETKAFYVGGERLTRVMGTFKWLKKHESRKPESSDDAKNGVLVFLENKSGRVYLIALTLTRLLTR